MKPQRQEEWLFSFQLGNGIQLGPHEQRIISLAQRVLTGSVIAWYSLNELLVELTILRRKRQQRLGQ